MPLLDELRERLGRRDLESFRLMGEDLVALGPPDLDEEPRVAEARKRLLRETHEFVVRRNVGIHERVRGYLDVGRRMNHAYPWPVVAILGIGEVLRGLGRVHLFGLAGSALARVGVSGLAESVERSDDVLRRTNRGIFADSVPTVLFAIRCWELERAGQGDVANALLHGPRPLLMDEESLELARALARGLAMTDEGERFRTLADLTLRHFAREQAIFTHHLGGDRPSTPGARRSIAARLLEPRSVSGPCVRRKRGRQRLVYSAYPLPEGFSMRDHDARVAAFGDAFVRSVTASPEDFAVAVDYVERRFG